MKKLKIYTAVFFIIFICLVLLLAMCLGFLHFTQKMYSNTAIGTVILTIILYLYNYDKDNS